MATLNEKVYLSEWLKTIVDPAFSYENRAITAVPAATETYQSGHLLDAGVTAATGAAVDGILADYVSLEELQAGCVKLVVCRGPVTINSSKLSNAAVVGDATQFADAITALAALDIRVGAAVQIERSVSNL